MDTKKAPMEFQGLSEVELEESKNTDCFVVQLNTIYLITVNIPPKVGKSVTNYCVYEYNQPHFKYSFLIVHTFKKKSLLLNRRVRQQETTGMLIFSLESFYKVAMLSIIQSPQIVSAFPRYRRTWRAI